jgi:tetratricopeptide (TPR) repeat protein
LSIFQGGFDREAAFQIAGAGLPLLASLSAKSLVRRGENERYDLHEVIRQYALAHLQSRPNHQETYARHCEYYLTWAAGYQEALKSARQQEALRRLTDDIDNLRLAWAWAIRHEKFDQLGAAGKAFGWYFEISGLYQDGLEQLERLVQALKVQPPDHPWGRVQGLALVQQALLYFRTGRFAQAAQRYEEGAAILRPLGDPALLADALIYGGTITHLKGDYARARAMLDEGRALAQTVRCRWLEAYATINLGYITAMLGCYAEGYEEMLAGLAIFRSLGDPHAIALAQNFMTPVLNIMGKYAEAKVFLQESIDLCERTQNRWGMGTAYGYLGLVCTADGEYAAAREHLHKSLELFGEHITGWNVGRSLTYLGHANRLDGDFTAARKNYVDVLRLSLESEATPIVLDALSGLAFWQEQAGSPEIALLLCCYVIRHPSSEDETKARLEPLRQTLESKMTPEQVQATQAAASEITFDELVTDAMTTP